MVDINDVRSVLKAEDGWFEPDMPSKQYIFDIKLTKYQYIHVRVITGIHKDGQSSHFAFARVLAINFNKKNKGWIKSTEISLNMPGWEENLLNCCRKMWQRAMARAYKEKLVKEYLTDIAYN